MRLAGNCVCPAVAGASSRQPSNSARLRTAISVYDEAALVEVPEKETGEALDVHRARELREIRPRHRIPPENDVGA